VGVVSFSVPSLVLLASLAVILNPKGALGAGISALLGKSFSLSLTAMLFS